MALKFVWRSLYAGIAGSNPTDGMNVRLLCLLWSLVHSNPIVCVCVSNCVCVWSSNLSNTAAQARVEFLCHK